MRIWHLHKPIQVFEVLWKKCQNSPIKRAIECSRVSRLQAWLLGHATPLTMLLNQPGMQGQEVHTCSHSFYAATTLRADVNKTNWLWCTCLQEQTGRVNLGHSESSLGRQLWSITSGNALVALVLVQLDILITCRTSTLRHQHNNLVKFH